jgi:hypothetical protein
LSRLALAWAWSWLAGLTLLTSCESAQEKCDLARSAAAKQWSAYVGVLSDEQVKAKATIVNNRRELGALDARIGERAKGAADRLYVPGSDAWLRGYHVAFNDQCAKDPECSGLKRGISEAEAAIIDLDERLVLARKASHATAADPTEAKNTAAACILDPAHAVLKVAQAASAEVYARCAELPPPATGQEPR